MNPKFSKSISIDSAVKAIAITYIFESLVNQG